MHPAQGVFTACEDVPASGIMGIDLGYEKQVRTCVMGKYFAQKTLCLSVSIHLRRVQQCHTGFDACTQRVLFGFSGTGILAQIPGTLTQNRDGGLVGKHTVHRDPSCIFSAII